MVLLLRSFSWRSRVSCRVQRSALGQQSLDLLLVAGMHVGIAGETTRARRRLLLEQVLAHGLLAAQLAAARLLEPLCSGFRCLHLRHYSSPTISAWSSSPAGSLSWGMAGSASTLTSASSARSPST